MAKYLNNQCLAMTASFKDTAHTIDVNSNFSSAATVVRTRAAANETSQYFILYVDK